MGKGSIPRPFSVKPDEFGANWERVFGKDDKRAKDGPPIEGQAVEQPEGLSDGKAADLRDAGAV